ncbi:MAG: PIN domain-containing protein [Candidatus Roizmanbacteria bacterium]
MRKILVDADAFIGIVKKVDSHHSHCSSIVLGLNDQDVQYWTSNYVFSEVVTVLSLRGGKNLAEQYITSMKNKHSQYQFVFIDERIEQQAIDIWKKQRSKNTSFVDCTNMALMNDQKFDCIFSFDNVYTKNGILTISSYSSL